LRIVLKGDIKNLPSNKVYATQVNAQNYKEVAMILEDLERMGVPIKKAIKEFNLRKSDWEILFGR